MNDEFIERTTLALIYKLSIDAKMHKKNVPSLSGRLLGVKSNNRLETRLLLFLPHRCYACVYAFLLDDEIENGCFAEGFDGFAIHCYG